MTITVLSVNLRPTAETIVLGARSVETGIRKQPVERAFVSVGGLEGDVVADQVNHGGPDQAVYVYSAEDLAWWEQELGAELPPGSFGENLTLSSFGTAPVRIGDRYRVGEATLQATAARIPCSVFAQHVARSRWVKRFAAARRPGFYARVLEAGVVGAGDPVSRLAGGEGHPEIVTTLDTYFDPAPAVETLEALLAAPLAARARTDYEEKLARITR
jgi:MOSC domain-containing protein YiiM